MDGIVVCMVKIICHPRQLLVREVILTCSIRFPVKLILPTLIPVLLVVVDILVEVVEDMLDVIVLH